MKFVNQKDEFSFDDILLLPKRTLFSQDMKKTKFNIKSKLTKDISIQIPIVASPMRTVTEIEMATTLGKMGGIGFIHPYQNMDRQLEQIFEVKLHKVKVGATVNNFSKENISNIGNLLKAGADIILLDAANAHSNEVIKFIKTIKKRFPKLQVSVGVVVTKDGVVDLIKAGADSIRVGIGAGSHCTTRIVTAIGRPQLSALYECAIVARKYQIPVICDGGIKYPGDLVKAIVFGADAVMIGGLFAGTAESPGKIRIIDGNKYKYSAGSTTQNVLRKVSSDRLSIMAMRTFHSEYGDGSYNPFSTEDKEYLEEGVEGVVKYKGSVKDIIKILITALIRSMWYQGVGNLSDLSKYAQVVKITNNAFMGGLPRLDAIK